MALNNKYNCSCGCKTVSSCTCRTTCTPNPVCVVPPKPNPKMTLEDLILLIDSKCDKSECEAIKKLLPDSTDGFQLVSNMIDTLDGDLVDKYPSALLLKEELVKLWECVYTRHKHYGDWTLNVVTQAVSTIAANCLLEDNANSTQIVQVPIDTGDTVTYDGYVWMSLCEDNVSKPKAGTCWINLTLSSAGGAVVGEDGNNGTSPKACGTVGFLSFDTCEELEAYAGTEDCPLNDGQLAVVNNPATQCFDLYKYSTSATTADIAGMACGELIGSVVSTTSIWREYSDCHDNYLIAVASELDAYVLAMKDGTEFRLLRTPPAPAVDDNYLIAVASELDAYVLAMKDGTEFRLLRTPPAPAVDDTAYYKYAGNALDNLDKGLIGEYLETQGTRHSIATVTIEKAGVYDITLFCLVVSAGTVEGKGVYYLYKNGIEVMMAATNDSRSSGNNGVAMDSQGSMSPPPMRFVVGDTLEMRVGYHNQDNTASTTFYTDSWFKAIRIGA